MIRFSTAASVVFSLIAYLFPCIVQSIFCISLFFSVSACDAVR